MKTLNLAFIILFLGLSNSSIALAQNEHGHSETHAEQHEGHVGHEEQAAVHLSAAQIKAAGIVTTSLVLSTVNRDISAPGEIQLNAYASSRAVSRISAQIIERHAQLGDKVVKGQALVTLSSVAMAKAQGELLVATREWQRVRKLGRNVVSASRYTKAKVSNDQARSTVQAYGMSQQQLDTLLKGGKAVLADGRFQLLALQHGTVIHDDFILGELVEPGRMLFEISDESTLWVNARLTAEQALNVKPGADARIHFRHNVLQGKVIQRHHSLDETTRTIGARLEVQNPNDVLHPGLFVDVKISSNSLDKALPVPADAVLRSPDGDWMVFVEHESNKFEPQEVDVILTSNGITVIEGIKAGTRVVTHGAFFLQSELAKSGFEIHNH